MALDIDTRPVSKDKFGNAFDNLPQSSEEDEPVQIKRKSFKKALDSSDDETGNLDSSINESNAKDDALENSEQSSEDNRNETNKSPLSSKKKKQRRVVIESDSNESDVDDPDERPASRNLEEDHGAQQRKILESLRSDNAYDAESSEGEGPASGSDVSNHSDEGTSHKSKKAARPKPPGRKSAVACRAAMQKERLKMVSESQRMVRESKASLPYHKPRQRSLKEFLSARLQPSPLLRGSKFQQADIALIGQEMEEQEKLAEEFYKPASDEEERLTPPPPEVSPGTPVEDKVLRVLLTPSHEPTKDTPAVTDKMVIADDSCLNTEPSTDQSPGLCDVDSAISEKQIVCESVENVCSDTPAVMDQNMESDVEPMEVVEASKVEEPKTLESETVKESLDSGVGTCPDLSESTATSAGDSQTVLGEIEKTQLIPSLKPFSIPKFNASTELSDACLTPSDALKESDIFLKPVAKSDDSKSKEIPVEDSVDTEDFHLFYEDSDDIIKSCKEDNEKPLTTSDIEVKPVSPEKTALETTTSGFNLAKLYNSKEISSSDDEDSKVEEKPKGKARILANLKLQAGPVRLKGSSGGVIDLDEDSEVKAATGVDDLLERFLRHAQSNKKKGPRQDGLLGLLQAGEELGDTTSPQARPGAKMNLLKTELRHSIAKQRDEEFSRRQKEYQLYDNETEGMLGDDDEDDVEGKLLSDDEEEAAGEVEGAESEGSTETEPELEDDVELRDAPLPDTEFLDPEAAESEEEEGVGVEGEGVEGEGEGEEDLEEEESESEGEGEEETSEEGDDAQDVEPESNLTGGRKKFQRIKLVADSDEEDGTPPLGNPPAQQVDSVPDTQLLEAEEDAMDKSYTSSTYNKSFNLSMLETSLSDSDKRNTGSGSPGLGDLCATTQRGMSADATGTRMPQGITQLIEESRSGLDLPGVTADNPEDCKKGARGFPRGLSDLFQSSESLGDVCSDQLTQAAVPQGLERLVQGSGSFPGDLGALCSGQFLTQGNDSQGISKELGRLIGDSKTQADDLAEICSGQFITQTDTQSPSTMSKELSKLVGGSNTVPENLADICSGQFITQASTQGISKELSKLVGGSNTVAENLADICSGQFITQASTQGMSKELNKLVGGLKTDEEDLADLCSGQFLTQAASQIMKDEEPKDTQDDLAEGGPRCVEMRIVSSDEEDDGPDVAPRKGKRKLAFSDDEDDGEAEALSQDSEEDSDGSDVEDSGLATEGGYVDYDSEENEVVLTEAPPRLRPGHFVDAEAELSESEWGSADEDERGLDQLEEELGDAEKFDEHVVKEQLGKIHARRMLDEDKRDVRLFQEAFLEDGDLHSEGEGRQRSFRWKNADDGSWAAGANPNLSGEEGGEEDDEGESTWRSARLERETWLQENKDKVAEGEGESSHLLALGRSLLAKMDSSRVKVTTSRTASGTKPPGSKDQSPGKAILHSLKGKSGSFLARRSISMTRMVALSGGESEPGCTSVLAATSRNFVFSSVSPASAKNTAAGGAEDGEQRPAVKRRAPAAKKTGPPPAAKKQRPSASVFSLMQ